MKKSILIFSILIISACSNTPKEYEADIFPDGEFKPINPEYFNKDEAQRIFEGMKPK